MKRTPRGAQSVEERCQMCAAGVVLKNVVRENGGRGGGGRDRTARLTI